MLNLSYISFVDEQELKTKVEEWFTISKLSIHFNKSKTTIRYWLKCYNITLKRGARGKLPKDNTVLRKCKCGETNKEKFYGNKISVCAKCHNEYTIQRGIEQRQKIIQHLGGKCSLCGFSKYRAAMQVHHTDPKLKDTAFTQVRSWSWSRVEKELASCILLCANCHAALHSKELIIGESPSPVYGT